MSRNAARPSWLLLGCVTALGPLAMSVHVPGIDDIASTLHETVLRAQLSVPVFIVAFGFCMFGAGVVVDGVGLRLALGGGLLTFIFGATGAIQMLFGAAGGALANSLGGLTPTTFGLGGVLVALTVLALARIGPSNGRSNVD